MYIAAGGPGLKQSGLAHLVRRSLVRPCLERRMEKLWFGGHLVRCRVVRCWFSSGSGLLELWFGGSWFGMTGETSWFGIEGVYLVRQ